MFNITLKRPLVTLAVSAGLLVAAAGSASASQSGPPHTDVNSYTHMEEVMLHGSQGAASGRGPLSVTLENTMVSSYQ